MRSTLILLLTFILLGVFLWINLSGALLLFAALGWLFLVVLSVAYTDTIVLYLLGAREVRSSDQGEFFEAASQEAYKLGVRMPRLYFYNGTMERAFVLQNGPTTSIVLNKSLLDKCSTEELSGVCFELLLQVKKGMAPKRTRVMFFLGSIAWAIHSMFALILMLIPIKEVKQAVGWFLNYFLHPTLDFLFKMILGGSYFKKLENALRDYPREKDLLDHAGLKFRRPVSYYSLPSRRLLEISSGYKSRHFQRILALEFLPHEWDYLFTQGDLSSAK